MNAVNTLYVLSDLHLAPDGPLNNFQQGAALAALLEQLPRAATLVLAGDTFDFLQLAVRPARLDWVEAPALLRQMLAAIRSSDEGARCLAALHGFVEGGGCCVVLPGNHDPELFAPECEAVLRAALGADEGLGLRVEREGIPLEFVVGGRQVTIGHGHRGDTWNDIDPAAVHRALERGERDQALPPGSLLVIETLNAFKRAVDPLSGAPRFPFIDQLKPEMPGVALLLLYLDPALACRHLPGAAGAGARALLRKLRASLRSGPTLGSSPSSAADPLDDLAQAIVASLDAGERAAPEAFIASVEHAVQREQGAPAPGMLASHSGALRPVLRAAIRRLSYNQTFFDPSRCSSVDETIIAALLPDGVRDRVVIAGHTHARREISLSDGRVYLNTGTWTDLLPLPTPTSDDALQQWVDALEQGTLEPMRLRSYAVVDDQGARLEYWP